MLETGVDLKTLKNSQALIGHDAGVLISVFRSRSLAKEEDNQLRNAAVVKDLTCR